MKKISLKCGLMLFLFLASIASIFCAPFLNSTQTKDAYATSGSFASTEDEGFWSKTNEGLPYALYTHTTGGGIENPYITYDVTSANMPAIIMSSKATADGGEDNLYNTTLHFAFNIPSAKDTNAPTIELSALDVNAFLNFTSIVVEKVDNSGDASLEFELNLLDPTDENVKIPTISDGDETPVVNPIERAGEYRFSFTYQYTDSEGTKSSPCSFDISFRVIDYYTYLEGTSGEALNIENANTLEGYEAKYVCNYADGKPVLYFDVEKFGLSFDYETESSTYSFTYGADENFVSFAPSLFHYPFETYTSGTVTGKVSLLLSGTDKFFDVNTYYMSADYDPDDAILEDIFYCAKLDLAEFEQFLTENGLSTSCVGSYTFNLYFVSVMTGSNLSVGVQVLDTTANENLLPESVKTQTLSVFNIEVSDISAVTANDYYSTGYKISDSIYASKTAKLLKENGDEFAIITEEYEVPNPDDPDGEPITIIDKRVDTTDLPEGIESIGFDDEGFTIREKADASETVLKFKYQIEFTLANGEKIVQTADVSVIFHGHKIVLVDGGDGEQIGTIQCTLNNPITADSLKQYIDTTKTTVPVDEISAEFISPINFYTETTGAVEFSYMVTEIAGETVNVKIRKTLGIEVVIPNDFVVSLEIGKEGNFSNSINLGKVNYSKNWEFSGQLRANVKDATISITNTENFYLDVEETADFGIYNFTLTTKKILQGSQTIVFSADFLGHPNQGTITFVVEFEIDDVPVLIISEETKTLKKSITFGEIKAIIRDNIYSVSDVYGETRDASAVTINQTSLTSLYTNDSDVVACGEYVVTYSYTSNIVTGTNLTVVKTFTITVANNQPVFDDEKTKITSESSSVENNGQLYVNKTLDLEVFAIDENNDSLIFELVLQNDATISTTDVNTNIVPNTSRKYTISAPTVDCVSQINFTIAPEQNYLGNFSFTLSVFDDGTHTGGDSFDYVITYYETGIPVIELKTSNILIDDEAKSMEFDYDNDIWVLTILQQYDEINLHNFIERADDEFDDELGVDDLVISVTKESVPQTLTGTSFRFNVVGEYVVNYTLTDASGNETSESFKVVVNEIPNSTPTISPYILNLNEALDREIAFNETLTIDIDEYFTITDADASDELIYNNGFGVFKTADINGEKILCINSESFSWNENILTFKQDSANYYVGKLYIAIIVDDGTGLPSGISEPAYIEITFVDNVPLVITQTSDKTTFVIGQDDTTTFNKASYFKAVNVFNNQEITPVVDIRDENNQNVTNIDFTKVGTYTLNYYFAYTPQGGTQEIVERQITINIITGGKPTIVLTQEELTITVGKGLNIQDIISQVQDAEDGSLTYEQIKDKIVVTGMPEDLSVPGEYKITISYADSDGNQTQKEFTLKVVEPSTLWIWILVGVGGAIVLTLLIVLIIFLNRKRYLRI